MPSGEEDSGGLIAIREPNRALRLSHNPIRHKSCLR